MDFLIANPFDANELTTDNSSVKATGAGGSVDQQRPNKSALQILDFALTNFTIRLMNLDYFHCALAAQSVPETDGVIGADVLALGAGIIDYENLVLYLKRP